MITVKGETTLPSFIRIELIIPTEIVHILGNKIYHLLYRDNFTFEKDKWGASLTIFALGCSVDMNKAITYFDTALDLYSVKIGKLHKALKELSIAHELLFYWIPLRYSEHVILARNFSTLQHYWAFCINKHGQTLTHHYFKDTLEKPKIFSRDELKDLFEKELEEVQEYLITSEKVRELLEQEDQQTRRDILMAKNLLEGTGE